MIASIVGERDRFRGLFRAITHDARDVRPVTEVAHVNVVEGVAIAIVNIKCLPLFGEDRLDPQVIDFQIAVRAEIR